MKNYPSERRVVGELLFRILQLPTSQKKVALIQHSRVFVRGVDPMTNKELQQWLNCSRHNLHKILSRLRQNKQYAEALRNACHQRIYPQRQREQLKEGYYRNLEV